MKSHSIKTIQDIVGIVDPENVEQLIYDLSDTLREIARLKEKDPEGYFGINHEEFNWTPNSKMLIVYSLKKNENHQSPKGNQVCDPY